MRDLVDTVEMYLRTIFDLVEEGVEPRRARIAERLEQTQPTVSQTVARMQRDGLIELRPDRQLELTEEGFALAASVTRKHRLSERLQSDPDDLTELRAAGIVTDARVTIEVGDETVTVTGPDGIRCELPEETAHGVQVRLL